MLDEGSFVWEMNHNSAAALSTIFWEVVSTWREWRVDRVRQTNVDRFPDGCWVVLIVESATIVVSDF